MTTSNPDPNPNPNPNPDPNLTLALALTLTRTRTRTQAHRALLAGWVEAAADQVKLDDEVREQLDGCVREATRSL